MASESGMNDSRNLSFELERQFFALAGCDRRRSFAEATTLDLPM